MYEDPGSAVPQSDWDGEPAYFDDQNGEEYGEEDGEGEDEEDQEEEIYDE